MGTNDVLKNEKNFEEIFEKNLIQQIKTSHTMYNFFIYLSQTQKRPYMHTHAKKKKKKRKRNINPKRCTIEKYKFKTKFAQNIGNKTIYTISPMTLMT